MSGWCESFWFTIIHFRQYCRLQWALLVCKFDQPEMLVCGWLSPKSCLQLPIVSVRSSEIHRGYRGSCSSLEKNRPSLRRFHCAWNLVSTTPVFRIDSCLFYILPSSQSMSSTILKAVVTLISCSTYVQIFMWSTSYQINNYYSCFAAWIVNTVYLYSLNSLGAQSYT